MGTNAPKTHFKTQNQQEKRATNAGNIDSDARGRYVPSQLIHALSSIGGEYGP